MGRQWSGSDIRDRTGREFAKRMSNPGLPCEPTFAERPSEDSMTLRPFVSPLSIVTAYIAFAFVGAIVLGVF
jgi:hypothetical protein